MATMTSPVISVTAASGGLGASSLAAALGAALAKRHGRSILVDLDLDGGGLDVTCGVDHLDGLRWPDLAQVRGPVPVGGLVAALPERRGCSVLAAGASRVRPAEPGPGSAAVEDVLGSLASSGDPLVLDLPRARLGALGTPASPWLLLTGTRTRELADLDVLVTRMSAVLPESHLGATVVVTTGRQPPAALVAAVEAHLGLTHLAHIARDSSLSPAIERGHWPSSRAFADAISAVLDWTWRRVVA